MRRSSIRRDKSVRPISTVFQTESNAEQFGQKFSVYIPIPSEILIRYSGPRAILRGPRVQTSARGFSWSAAFVDIKT